MIPVEDAGLFRYGNIIPVDILSKSESFDEFRIKSLKHL